MPAAGIPLTLTPAGYAPPPGQINARRGAGHQPN
jgi:hypothetical protein